MVEECCYPFPSAMQWVSKSRVVNFTDSDVVFFFFSKVQTPVHTPKPKKLKRISSETTSSALFCEAMKLWTDAVQQNQLRVPPPTPPPIASAIASASTDEITLYCLSYAARLKTLPIEAVDDIRCQMESLMRDARLKFNKT